jgi:DNA-binding Lrp family transcriptional regulator
MDEKDREILQMLQAKFPLDPEPYQVLGDRLWIDEVGVISRIARMIQAGTIRHIGPFFNSKKMGYIGALCAMNVAEGKIDEVAQVINQFPGITHNYQRDGEPNIWFTLIAKNEESRKQILDQIKKESGISEILVFPSKKLYKVKVDID